MSSRIEEAGDEAKISDGQAERALEKVKIYTDDGKTVSPIVRSEVYDGLFSLREWLEDRKMSGKKSITGRITPGRYKILTAYRFL